MHAEAIHQIFGRRRSPRKRGQYLEADERVPRIQWNADEGIRVCSAPKRFTAVSWVAEAEACGRHDQLPTAVKIRTLSFIGSASNTESRASSGFLT